MIYNARKIEEGGRLCLVEQAFGLFSLCGV
jgi:hypothetical protein